MVDASDTRTAPPSPSFPIRPSLSLFALLLACGAKDRATSETPTDTSDVPVVTDGASGDGVDQDRDGADFDASGPHPRG